MLPVENLCKAISFFSPKNIFHQELLVYLQYVYNTTYSYYPKVAPEIKARMMEAGTTMVGYQPLGNYVNFFRMIVSNPASTKTDIDFMLDEIERLGKTIEFEES